MKKSKILIITLIILLIVSGCGKSKKIIKEDIKTTFFTCSGVQKNDSSNADMNIKYTFENDKITKAKVEITFKDFNINNLPEVWSSIKEQITEQNKPVEDLGYKRTVKSDDEKYTYTIIIEIDYRKITKEIMKKYDVSDFSDKTSKEVKKATVNENITCK